MLKRMLIAVALAPAFVALGASAGDLPTRKAIPIGGGRTIAGLSVDGEAEETVKPDVAVVSLEAVDELPSGAAASARNAETTRDLMAALKKLGVDEAEVSTESLELTPLYRERAVASGGDERVLAGYRASTMLRARLHNVDAAPKIARALIESGSDAYRGVSFFVSDREARFEALRIKAMADAAKRAKVYAESAGTLLCQVLDMASGAGANPGRSERDLVARRGDVAAGPVSIPTAAAPEVLRAHVALTWALPPARPDSCEAEKPGGK